MTRTFIEIRKSELKQRLNECNIRAKFQNNICAGVKSIIMDSLDDFIQQAIEQNRIVKGLETLEKYQK